MTGLRDILLPVPVPEALARYLLFGVFSLHLLFVLLMLGTGMLALAYFIHAWWGNRLPGPTAPDRVKELRWDKRILRAFLAHKSLAVVLGVGPLLLIQVLFPIPFFTSVVLFAAAWLMIIIFLIGSFLSFDSLGHKIYVHRYLHLGFGLVAMAALLAVPGFFVAVLVSAENSDKWMDIIRSGFAFDPRLMVHWIFRYLHVLGAAVVFGAAFHYLFTARHQPARRRSLAIWMLCGLLWQAPVGMGLYLTLFQQPTVAMYIYLLVAVILTGVFIGLASVAVQRRTLLGPRFVIPGLLVLLVAMLLVRQGFQDRAFGSIIPAVRTNAAADKAALDAYQEEALAAYQTHLATVYDTGPVIHANSCAFCHGADGQGDGPDAHQLAIPPAHLAEIRSTRAYLYEKVSHGIPGSGMPYFSYFSPPKREAVLTYLNDTWHVFSPLSAVPATVSSSDAAAAAKAFDNMCSKCHGMDGRGATEMAAKLSPGPPDFTAFMPQPKRAFQIITKGYPGTAMDAHGQFAEGVRWALVERLRAFAAPALVEPSGDAEGGQ